jgi:hypothetical protein
VGLNTHHADSYLMFELPADGSTSFTWATPLEAAARSMPIDCESVRPGPTSPCVLCLPAAGLRSKSGVSASVYVIRKDGFDGDITLNLKDPPEGFHLVEGQAARRARKWFGSA